MLSLIHLQAKLTSGPFPREKLPCVISLPLAPFSLSLHVEVSAPLPLVSCECCLVNCSESKSGWDIYPEQIVAGCIPMSTCAMLISYKVVHYSVGHK